MGQRERAAVGWVHRELLCSQVFPMAPKISQRIDAALPAEHHQLLQKVGYKKKGLLHF